MTATKEEFKYDMHKDPAELEREADRARANVESTLEALERRLSPGELLDQVLHVVKDNGGAFGTNLATQVRNNPVPVLLTGIGMTWLMVASDQPPKRYPRYGYGTGAGHDIGSRVGGAMESTQGAGSSAMESAQGAGSSAMESARGAASSATGAARDAASRAADAASRAGDSARSAAEGARHTAQATARGVADTTRASAEGIWDTYEYMRREQPLALGALAVAAGALLGSMLPSTTTENRMMGEQSDEATERLKEKGRSGVDQARTAAADAAEAARESVQPKRAGRAEPPSGSGSGSATR